MNKKRFFKLLGLCAGLSLAVGAGVALSSGGEAKQVNAVETEQYRITFTKGTNDSGTTAPSIASGSDYATLGSTDKAYARTNGMHLSSSKAAGTATLTMTSSGQIKASKLVVNALAKSGKSFTVTPSYTDDTSDEKTTITPGTSTCDKDVVLDSNKTLKSIKFDAASSTGTGIAYVAVYAENSGDTPTDSVSLSVDPTSLDLEVGENETFDVSITSTGSYGTEFMVESGDESVATVSPDVGDGNKTITVTAVGAGDTTITVSSLNGDQTATVDVSVSEPEAAIEGSFNLFSGSIAEGDYVLVYDGSALKNSVSSDRLDYSDVTITNNTIKDPLSGLVWHIAPSGDYWTIYNNAVGKYAASTGAKNKAQLLDDGTDDKSLWSVTGSSTYEFVNKQNSANSVNANLHKNGTYGFACYASNTGGALSLYKKHVAYTIQYDGNNGLEETMPNSETTVSECTFTAPVGQEFDHWNTSTDNKGTSYAPGDIVSESCTLYAIWKDKIASVSVNPASLALEVGGASKTVTATPINISNPEYSWAKSSGDDCISLTNDDAAAVSVAVADGFNDSGSCTLTVTVTGTLGANEVTRTADVAVTVTKVSTADNPYTVTEAIAIATAQGRTESTTTAYVKGYLIAKNSNGSQIFLTNNPNSIDVTHTLSMEEKSSLLCVYKSGGVTGIGDVNVGDQVTISGKPVLFDSNGTDLPEFASGEVVSSVAETMIITKTVDTDTLTINSPFSYSGVVSIDYTHKTDIPNANELVTFSECEMSTIGNQTVTISYSDAKLGKEASTKYTLKVEYAAVSSVTLNYHNLTVNPNSDTKFSVALNADVDPASKASWVVANVAESSLDLSKYKIVETGDLTATLECKGSAEEVGDLVVTVTVGGVSDSCSVKVIGKFITFDKSSVNGIVGAKINNTVTVSASGFTPNSWNWSVTSGKDVVEATTSNPTTGDPTTTLDFKAAGTANLHVAVSDGNDTFEDDITVNVIEKLNGINSLVSGTATWAANDSIAIHPSGQTNDPVDNDIDENIHFKGDKGTNSTDFRHWSDGIRAYAGNTVTFSPLNGAVIKTITLPTVGGTCSDANATKSGDVWTIKNGSGDITFSGLNKGTIKTDIVVTYEIGGDDIANTNYNAQKAAIEFAKDLTSKLNAVCDQEHGNTTLEGENGLIAKWSAIASAFNSIRNALSKTDRDVFDALIANASKSEEGDVLQKALASYDYVYGKYHASFDGEDAGSSDFLKVNSSRAAAPSLVTPRTNPIAGIVDSDNTMPIIVIVSLLAITAVGGYLFLRRRNEQ